MFTFIVNRGILTWLDILPLDGAGGDWLNEASCLGMSFWHSSSKSLLARAFNLLVPFQGVKAGLFKNSDLQERI